jgi:hypothetical protein
MRLPIAGKRVSCHQDLRLAGCPLNAAEVGRCTKTWSTCSFISTRTIWTGKLDPRPIKVSSKTSWPKRASATRRSRRPCSGWTSSLWVSTLPSTIRIYSDAERAKLDLEARGLLLFLEQNGILDPVGRELVIDRVLAIDHDGVSVDELKWVVLLVLMNRPGQEAAFTQMEDLVYNEESGLLH